VASPEGSNPSRLYSPRPYAPQPSPGARDALRPPDRPKNTTKLSDRRRAALDQQDASSAAPVTPPGGIREPVAHHTEHTRPHAPVAYPRRRDLRRQGARPVRGTTQAPRPPEDPGPGPVAGTPAGQQSPPATGGLPLGLPLPSTAPIRVPEYGMDLDDQNAIDQAENDLFQSVTPTTGSIPTSAPLPRRRDLRRGDAVVPGQANASIEVKPRRPGGSSRSSAASIGMNSARIGVMAMLVGVGYIAVTGQNLPLSPDNASDSFARNGNSAGSQAMASPTPHETYDWNVQDEVRTIKSTNDKLQKQRIAAAEKAAAEKAAAQKAAREAELARQRAREEALRNAQRDPKSIAQIMVRERGWSNSQWECLNLLWTRESGWNYQATNASSGAYGIPQSLPGSKMASVASDWRTNPVTQIKWGLNYIEERYGNPCGAWAHSEATGWY